MDDKTRQDMAGQSSATLGGRLMARRKELGWRLEDVEAYLKVRLATLQAIESGRYSDLPDAVYALGFIKSYACLLGMESEELIQQAKRELSALTPKRQTVHLTLPGPQEGRSAGLWALLGIGLVVIAGGYAGWYHFSSHGQLASSIMPSHLADNAEVPHAAVSPAAPQQAAQAPATQPVTVPSGAVSAPTGAQEAATKPDDGAKDTPDLPPAPEVVSPSATAVPSTVDAAGNDVSHTGGGDHPADVPAGASVPSVQPVPEVPKAPFQSSAPTQTASTPNQDAGDRVELLVREDSWVQITDASGKSLLARVLKKGESWQGNAGETYHVTSGNAGGVVFQAGNVVSAPLGLRGRVVRNVTVDAASVEQGHYGYGSLATGVTAAPEAADKRSQ